MFKFWGDWPISGRAGVACALAAAGLFSPAAAGAFPATTGAGANRVLGQPDFTTGFVDFSEDQFFGADFPSEKRFFVPRDAAFDEAADRLFVADLHNARILVFDLSGGVPDDADLAATFVLGQPDFSTGGADAVDARWGDEVSDLRARPEWPGPVGLHPRPQRPPFCRR